jgi:hypothetical protein
LWIDKISGGYLASGSFALKAIPGCVVAVERSTERFAVV